MPGGAAPVGQRGVFPPHWVAIIDAIQTLQRQVAALTSGAQQTNITDQFGNTQVILGQLNQVVTIGASQGQAGVLVGTGLPASGKPNVGQATQQNLVTTTITTTAGSVTATVGSAAGLVPGMIIGAANVTDPASGVATPAITPGTTISSISGTTVTLSANAAESGTSIYCAACWWLIPGVPGPYVSQARSFNTVYQPSLTRPTLVLVTLRSQASNGTTNAHVFMDASTTPTTEISPFQLNTNTATQVVAYIPTSFVVPPAYRYKITGDPNASIQAVYEQAW